MPTTLRLLFLLMLGFFGLQPVNYGYDAPTAFVSGAQNIVAASLESQAATVGIAAPKLVDSSHARPAWDDSDSIGQFPNFVAAETEAGATKWIWGQNKGPAQLFKQMEARGWTPQQITEAIEKGKQFPAENLVNPGNPAIRYVNPVTGRSVVVDQVTKEVIHVGGDGFKY